MQITAFGNPDGSKGLLEERVKEFVHLDWRKFPNGISAADSSRNIRVVVGKKGSGKTLYLRRLQDSARQEDSVFAADLTEDIPGTDTIVNFCQLFDRNQVDEAWEKAWKLAIIRSTISYITVKKFFSSKVDISDFIEKLSNFSNFLPKYQLPRSIYAELTEIVSRFNTGSGFMKYAQDSSWNDIQKIVSNFLMKCPPVFLYLDGMDEEFQRAPMEWLRCQRGLYSTVMRLARKQNSLGSRLHIVIAVRDFVYLSLMSSNENSERHRNAPEVSLLDWDYSAISYFLNEKIRQIPETYGRYSGVDDFAGLSQIYCPSRQGAEEITRYLIRHTRLLPRDIVQLGNEIAMARQKTHARKEFPGNWQDILKLIVSRNAQSFAKEQIEICANQIASHDAPLRSSSHGYAEFYTSNKEYIAMRSKTVKEFIHIIGKESFSESELNDANVLIEDKIPKHVNLGTILWQNGLIGIKQRPSDLDFEFCNLNSSISFSIPEGCNLYAFHPIILDAVSGINVNLTIAPGGVNVERY